MKRDIFDRINNPESYWDKCLETTCIILVAAICAVLIAGACWLFIVPPFKYLPTAVAIIIEVILFILLISGIEWIIEKEKMGSKPDD